MGIYPPSRALQRCASTRNLAATAAAPVQPPTRLAVENSFAFRRKVQNHELAVALALAVAMAVCSYIGLACVSGMAMAGSTVAVLREGAKTGPISWLSWQRRRGLYHGYHGSAVGYGHDINNPAADAKAVVAFSVDPWPLTYPAAAAPDLSRCSRP